MSIMEQPVVVDIADEVIRFAHGQGHTKASKDTINWSGLETKSAKPEFTQTSRQHRRKLFTSKDQKTLEFMEHLSVKGNDNNADMDLVTAMAVEKGKEKFNSGGVFVTSNICISGNCLINVSDDKMACSLTFKSGLSNIAEAHVKLSQSLTGVKNSLSETGKVPLNSRRSSLPTTTLDMKYLTKQKTDNKSLSRVPLMPKFKAWLQLPGVKDKKLMMPCAAMHEVVTQIHPGIKIPVEVLQQTDCEKGTFIADYYVWGYVTITVWGKPFNVKMNDVLDPKNNELFTKENIAVHNLLGTMKTPDMDQTQSVIKYQIKGEYEIKKTTYEIKLKVPNCILRRPSYNMLSLKCNCDTTDLPAQEKLADSKPITNKNLAQIILRWRQIHYSFRHKKIANENEWLWKTLLTSDTALAAVAQTAEVDKLSESTPIDKFLMTLLLWREKCTTIGELAEPGDPKNQYRSGELIELLYQVGVPVPVVSFLLSKDGKIRNEDFQCPLHKFKKGTTPKWDEEQGHILTKLSSPLPDRVLTRFMQRWEDRDGWLLTALNVGISNANIASIASDTKKFPTLSDKRMMVFKLWRMQQRRDSSIATESAIAQTMHHCTVQDFCKVLSDLEIPQSVYSFLWTDSETTP